jgi:2-succinyl-6-hydroxy-2,4-cyclohexadiene-1-carboxylate synthase
MLLHGFAGGPAHLRVIAEQLGREVIVPTLSGHLGTPVPRGWTFDDEVDRLAALIVAPAIVAGYSLGGRLAMRLAQRHPQKIRAVLAVSAHPGLRGEVERTQRHARDAEWAELLLTRPSAEFFTRWDAQPLFATRANSPGARVLRALREQHAPAQLSAAMRAFSLADMPTLSVARATVMAGALDTPLIARWQRPIVRVPNVGHDIVSEAPAAIARQIISLREETHHDPLEA